MFIDLFAGPGRYGDEVPSTPLRVLGSAVKDPALRDMLVGIFNDVDTEHVHSLQKAIDSKPELEHLKNRPQLSNIRVGNELVEQLEGVRLVPTLLFVDPWGYKGLSLRLIGSVLKDWGSDCIIFFNFNRINSGLTTTWLGSTWMPSSVPSAPRTSAGGSGSRNPSCESEPSSRRSLRLSEIWEAGSSCPSVSGWRTSTESATTSFS